MAITIFAFLQIGSPPLTIQQLLQSASVSTTQHNLSDPTQKISIIFETPSITSYFSPPKTLQTAGHMPVTPSFWHYGAVQGKLVVYSLFLYGKQQQSKQRKMLANHKGKNFWSTSRLNSPSFPLQLSYSQKMTTKSQARDEEAEEQAKKLELTSIDLFYWKAQQQQDTISSTFQLINLPEHFTPAQLVTLEHLQNLNFPVLRYKVKQLVDFSIKIIRTSQFCQSNFTERVTKKLVALLARNYNAVSYHNYSHAFYFTMLVYQCFNREHTLKHIVTDEEYFYIIAAGLCHDLNHNGSTNSFEVKTKSQLAIDGRNESVLQNMHLRHLWRLFEQNPDLDFIAPAKDRTRAKEIVTRLILSTDMAFHSNNLQRLRTMRKSSDFDLKRNASHKWSAIQQVFHACDIGNPCTDYNNYIAWGALLSHQFSEVARQERRLGLEVTKCFEMTTAQSVYKDQVWFIGCLVQPIWRELGELFPSLSAMNASIELNLKRVKEQLEKMKQ